MFFADTKKFKSFHIALHFYISTDIRISNKEKKYLPGFLQLHKDDSTFPVRTSTTSELHKVNSLIIY
jgi:hypothetical protein